MNTGNEKRMMVIFLLSLTLMIVSLYFMPKNNQLPNTTQVVETNQVVTNQAKVQKTELTNWGFNWEKGGRATNFLISYNNEIKAKIDTSGGRLSELSINGSWNRKKQDVALVNTNLTFKLGDFAFGSLENITNYPERPVFKVIEQTSNSIKLTASLRYKNNSIEVTKSFTVSNNYQIFEEIQFRNLSRNKLSLNFNGVSVSLPDSAAFVSRELANPGNPLKEQYFDGNKLQNVFSMGFLGFFGGTKTNILSVSNSQWICLYDNYFVSIMKPEAGYLPKDYTAKYIILKQEKVYKEDAFGIELPPLVLEANELKAFRVSYYIGPKKEDIMVKVDKTYDRFFTWPAIFNWFMKPIEWVLVKLMYVISLVVPNWGLIIILLAVIIKLALSPLSIQAAKSIKKSNLLQPKLKALQEKFKDDQQTLNQKVAELYKKEKVNPLGGCLPMLFQIPVFFALLRVLSNSVELKGASFLWISDLTQPDTLFKMSIPFLPNTFNLLPIIMTVFQIIQMRLQAMKTVGTQQQQSALNTYLLPVVFLFLFWSMPSGLVLYWTIQNIYIIIEQEIINLDRHIQLK